MNKLFYLGFIKKTHGFKGGVKILIEAKGIQPDKTEPLMLEINYKAVPFFIEQISGDTQEWQVKFEDIRSLEEAEEIVGLSVYMEREDEEEIDDFELDFSGFKIKDKTLGEIGTVVQVISKPGQDLLEIIHNENTYFIPLVEELIVKVDPKLNILHTILPDGLLDLNP